MGFLIGVNAIMLFRFRKDSKTQPTVATYWFLLLVTWIGFPLGAALNAVVTYSVYHREALPPPMPGALQIMYVLPLVGLVIAYVRRKSKKQPNGESETPVESKASAAPESNNASARTWEGK